MSSFRKTSGFVWRLVIGYAMVNGAQIVLDFLSDNNLKEWFIQRMTTQRR
jgi:hypothetical protein